MIKHVIKGIVYKETYSEDPEMDLNLKVSAVLRGKWFSYYRLLPENISL